MKLSAQPRVNTPPLHGEIVKNIEDCVVLHVEDDDATAVLFQLAMKEAKLKPLLFRMRDGAEALDFVLKTGQYPAAPQPDLIILDLNLPRMTGLEVLAAIKGNPHLRDIPAYILTTSIDSRDEAKAMALGATGYLTKGDSLEAFTKSVKRACQSLTGG
ncbi:MAG: response regulator [Bryobacteraceae bacterium]